MTDQRACPPWCHTHTTQHALTEPIAELHQGVLFRARDVTLTLAEAVDKEGRSLGVELALDTGDLGGRVDLAPDVARGLAQALLLGAARASTVATIGAVTASPEPPNPGPQG